MELLAPGMDVFNRPATELFEPPMHQDTKYFIPIFNYAG